VAKWNYWQTAIPRGEAIGGSVNGGHFLEERFCFIISKRLLRRRISKDGWDKNEGRKKDVMMKIAKEDETLKDETLKDEIVKKHLVNNIFLYLLTLNLFHQLSKKHLVNTIFLYLLTLILFHQLSKKHLASIVIIFV
jgi:hypothetical protein